MEKIPSGCPSPARIEKTDSSSSRQSGSPPLWDIESCLISDHLNREARIRPSSWDESDDDSLTESEGSIKSSRLYSNESGQFRGSVAAEINEIKKQFFETLIKGNDNWDLESVKEKAEGKLSSDRRQSPARMRRRTKSSSSSSPVLESKSHNSPENAEKPSQSEEVLEETSSKILEFDPKFYLNNFFSELRSKRISLIESAPRITEEGQLSDFDAECIQICNEEKIPNTKENDEYFCKTSRKLSQILEVEENKTDMEKSSNEKIQNSELLFFTLKRPEENDFSPLQTARSRKSEKIEGNIEETRKQEKKFKSVSYEEFENFRKNTQPFYGSLSERSTKIFDRKVNNNFVSLCSKTEKMQLDSLLSQAGVNLKNQFHLVSPASSAESNKNLPLAPCSKGTEKSVDSREYLKIDLMKTFKSENSTPRKSTERSERSQANKTLSAKSKRSCTFESPKFAINLGRDSERSLTIEDVNSTDSLGKNSDNRILPEMKTSSFENASPKKSNRNAGTPEHNFEIKADSNLRISSESLNQKSTKSSYRNSKELEANYLKSHRNDQKSHREKENQSAESERTEQIKYFMLEKTESYSSVESSRSYENPFNISSRSESFTKISNTDEQESKKNTARQSSKSSRGSKSNKSRTPNTLESQISDQETPRSHKIPELSLPLGIPGGPEFQRRSYWNETADLIEFTRESDQSETSTQKNASLRSSERSLSSRSKNSESKRSTGSKKSSRSTPQSLKAISKPISSISSKSKNNLENHDDMENEESFRTANWKELEKAYDTVSNSTPISSAGRRTIWRESDTSSRQNSDQRELLDFTSKNSDLSEERLTRSRKSSRGSVNSKVSDRLENNGPSKSVKEKSRPSSGTVEECKPPNINADAEKHDSDPVGIITFEKDEHSENNYSAQNFESDIESDGYLNKKLSIVNEVSFEDLETSVKNEETDVFKQSRPHSRRGSRQTPPQSNQVLSESLNENTSDESVFQLSNPDDERWNELIEKFYESSNTSSVLKKTLYSFSHRNENSHNFATNTTIEENELNDTHKNQDDFSVLSKRFESIYEPSVKNIYMEKTVQGEDDDTENSYSVYEERLLKKVLEEKDIGPLQNSQNLYFLNLDKEGPLEIGEFGDVTCCNTSQSDTAVSERPRDHGDGIRIQKATEILIQPEKRDKEVKTQRHLRTKLKDFRDSKAILNSLFLEVEDDLNFKDFIPIGLKKSKSDNCVKIKTTAEDDCENPSACILSECDQMPKNIEKKLDEFENYSERKNKKSLSNSTIGQHSSLESLTLGRYSENEEFECEMTPRLSRSLSNLNAQLEKENLTNRRSEEIFNFSRIQCFQKSTENSTEEKEFTDLSIFLARNENGEKISVKSNNWLNLKDTETKKFGKQNRKLKKKGNNSASSEDSFHEYLSSRKSRSNVLHLKFRNSNCLQNFYKRLISVFCLTSHSSATTSK